MNIASETIAFREFCPQNIESHPRRRGIFKPIAACLIILFVFWAAWGLKEGIPSDASTENAGAATGRLSSASQFVVAPCSTPITGGKASLVIGGLQGNAETYLGNYDLKVVPYFFMNEKGSLVMNIPNETVHKLDQGTPGIATGQAITKATGKTRKVTATLTPTTKDGGSVTFAFTGENTKLTFKSTYKRGGN